MRQTRSGSFHCSRGKPTSWLPNNSRSNVAGKKREREREGKKKNSENPTTRATSEQETSNNSDFRI